MRVPANNPLDAAGGSADLLGALFALDGDVAVVTGAGGGIGREIARMLARAGSAVIAADLDLATAQATVELIAQADGRAVASVVDVRTESSVQALFARAEEAFGSPTVLINNAGIFPVRPLLDITLEDWDRVQNTNLRGTFLCTREAIARMTAAGRGGRVLNISSIASVHPVLRGYAHYGASKGGINAFTRTVALEVAEAGIRVNALLIGGVEMKTRPEAADGSLVSGPATGAGRFPLGVAPAWLHAATALFLVGPSAYHMTGELIVADGGFLLS